MSDDEIKQLRQVVVNILPHPVALAYLYGSQATGQTHPWSDIDLALVTDTVLPPRDRLNLELTLETKLAAACGGNWDVRVINQAPLQVKGTVVQTGKLLYSQNDEQRVAFETSVRAQYFDFLPVIEMHREAYFQSALESAGLRGIS